MTSLPNSSSRVAGASTIQRGAIVAASDAASDAARNRITNTVKNMAVNTASVAASVTRPLFTTALLICAFSANTVSAQHLEPGDIAPFEAVYEVGNNLIKAGTAKLSLTRNNDLWTYTLKTSPRGVLKLAGKGKIEEQSTFRIQREDGELLIEPQTYRFRQDNEKRRQVDATFDWQNRTMTHSYRGIEETETFDEPVIDRLSATLLMMNLLRHGFESAELQVFDTGRMKSVAFNNIGMETLDTPLGEIETFRVINNKVDDDVRRTTTWFAPSLDYIPVKIEQLKRGKLVARLNLLRLENRVSDIDLDK